MHSTDSINSISHTHFYLKCRALPESLRASQLATISWLYDKPTKTHPFPNIVCP